MEIADSTIIPYESEYTRTYHTEPKFDGFLVFIGITILIMAVYFINRCRKILALKKRCTKKVSAVVTHIRSARSDDEIRYKYRRYNASYKYEFNGTEYNSRNNIFGGQKAFTRLKVGDSVTIHVNPDEPDELYDDLSNSALRSFFLTSAMLVFTGLFVIFGKFFIN